MKIYNAGYTNLPQNVVYCGRLRKKDQHFGNPFSSKGAPGCIAVKSRKESVHLFNQWLHKMIPLHPERLKWVWENRQTLKQADGLSCFCAPKLCHCHVYAWKILGCTYYEIKEKINNFPEEEYKLIIAGSRDVFTYSDLKPAIEEARQKSLKNPTTIISGTCRGPDRFGEQFARENKILLEKYPAEWNTHGKSAGYIRNELMAQNANALLALWDGRSKGTAHMINIANRKGLDVYVYRKEK